MERELPTAKDGVHSQKVHADGTSDHGRREAEKLIDHIPRGESQ